MAGRCDGTTKWDCLAGLPQPTTSAGQALPIHDSADKVRGSSDTFVAEQTFLIQPSVTMTEPPLCHDRLALGPPSTRYC